MPVDWVWIAVENMLIIKKMASSGYSGTPLIKKLGIKPDSKLMLINAPENYNDLVESDLETQLCQAIRRT